MITNAKYKKIGENSFAKISQLNEVGDTLLFVGSWLFFPIMLIGYNIVLSIPLVILLILDFMLVSYIFAILYLIFVAFVFSLPFLIKRYNLYTQVQNMVVTSRRMLWEPDVIELKRTDITNHFMELDEKLRKKRYELIIDNQLSMVNFEFNGDFRNNLQCFGIQEGRDGQNIIYTEFDKIPHDGSVKITYI